MMSKLEEFEKNMASLAGDSGGSGGSSSSAGAMGDDPNQFTLQNEILEAAGGMTPPTYDTSIENLGKMEFREFESKEALFDYI